MDTNNIPEQIPTTPNQEQTAPAPISPEEEKKDFIKQNTNIDPQLREKYKQSYSKVKVGIFFGYNGKNYHGLQKNDNVETIEGVLEQALYHADFIPPYNFDKLYKIGWGRGGRTDKGVHAVCNVINVKLCIHKDYALNNYEELVEEAKKNKQNINNIKKEFNWEAIIKKINENLPQQIQVLTIKKVTAKFNVRKMARSRIYEYFCPITLFRTQPASLIEELKKLIKTMEDQSKETQREINTKIDNLIITSQPQNYNYSKEEDEQLLEKINQLCKEYIGTKNFHNYTVKLKWNDPSAKRYMIEVEAKLVDPYEILEKLEVKDEKVKQILESSDKKLPQFLQFKIHGQSFMYHQIRKMMGMMIQTIYENLNISYMQNSFFGNTYNVWLGPPEGLLMNRITFEGYNYKVVPEKIEFSEKEEELMKKFKELFIYSQIITDEFFDYKLKYFEFTIWLGRQLSQGKNMEIEENEEIKGDDD